MSFTSTYPTNLVKLCYGKRVVAVTVSDAARSLDLLTKAPAKRLAETGRGADRRALQASKLLRDAPRALETARRVIARPVSDIARAAEKALRGIARPLRDVVFGDYGFRAAVFPAVILREVAKAADRLARVAAKRLVDATRGLEVLVARRVPGVNVLDVARVLDRVARGVTRPVRDLVAAADRLARVVASFLRERVFADYAHRVKPVPALVIREVVFGGQWSSIAVEYVRRVRDAARVVEYGVTLRFRLLCEYVRTVTSLDVILAADHNAVKRVLLCAVERLKAIRARLGA
jgi:hypothetical protein